MSSTLQGKDLDAWQPMRPITYGRLLGLVCMKGVTISSSYMSGRGLRVHLDAKWVLKLVSRQEVLTYIE